MKILSQVVAFLAQGYIASKQQSQDLRWVLSTINHNAPQFSSNLKIDNDTAL